MNDVLDDRLTELFDRVAAAVDVDEDLERAIGGTALEPRRAGRRGRTWIAAAAAAVVAVAGTVGVMQFVDRDPETTVAEAPVDPGPLYVLPGDREAWSPGFGFADSGGTGMLSGVTVGVPIEGGYLDPVAVSLSDTDPIDPPGRRATIRLPSGIAYLWSGDHVDTLVQRRDNDFLSASTLDGDTSRLSRAVDAIVIRADGTLDVAAESPLAVIDRVDEPWSGVGHTTYMELGGEHRVVVETISFAALVGAGAGSSEVRPTEARGANAWVMVRYDADGTWLGLTFPLAQGTVSLSGTVPEEVLLALAEDLEVVDEATWEAATGAD